MTNDRLEREIEQRAKTEEELRDATLRYEAVPVINDDGSIREWVGTVTDVEDEQQTLAMLGAAKSQIEQQKRELELIYESAPVGMSLVDRDRRFLRINTALARINGIPREVHLGQVAYELFDSLEEQIEPIYRKVFETGEPVVDVEVVGVTLGSKAEKTWLASYYPLKDDESEESRTGSVTAVSAIVQDITDR